MQNFSQHPFQDQEKLKCPRCDSTNTKFCYYNNYNLSQPRHFCKSCRRYWTKGGALRNIPVGGGSRKNAKRSGSAAAVTKRLAPTEENNEASLRPKGESSGHGQFGNLELTGNGEALPQKLVDFGHWQSCNMREVGGFGKSDFKALPLRLGDFGQGQFGNLAEVSGSFRSLLVGSSGVRKFGGLLDGLGSSGASLQASALLCDHGSGQNVDPQADGFLNIGGGDGGSWAAGAGGWPDLSI